LKAIYSPTVYRWQAGVQRVNLFQPEPAPGTNQVGGKQKPMPVVQKQDDSAGQKPTKDQTAEPIPGDQIKQKDETDVLDENEAQFLQKVSQHFTEQPADIDIDKLIKEKEELKKKVQIPQKEEVNVDTGPKPITSDQLPGSQTTTQVGGDIKPLTPDGVKNAESATFSPQAAPPAPPTQANVVVGQVIDDQGNIIDNTILEIKDDQGRPVRALKSNRLGHFMIVTPLVNGKYQIVSEKEGYKFNTITFEAKDAIIPPIAIEGQKTNEK
jgi:hypothetical protein